LPSGGKEGDVVGGETAIARDNRQALELGLGDQHPVEGVPVVERQVACGEGVFEADLQRRELLFFELCAKVVRRLQPSCFPFDRSLPG
jgi:hypothetical protein